MSGQMTNMPGASQNGALSQNRLSQLQHSGMPGAGQSPAKMAKLDLPNNPTVNNDQSGQQRSQNQQPGSGGHQQHANSYGHQTSQPGQQQSRNPNSAQQSQQQRNLMGNFGGSGGLPQQQQHPMQNRQGLTGAPMSHLQDGHGPTGGGSGMQRTHGGMQGSQPGGSTMNAGQSLSISVPTSSSANTKRLFDGYMMDRRGTVCN